MVINFSSAGYVFTGGSLSLMGHSVLNQHPVPHARGHSEDVQQAFILDFLDTREEIVIIVRRVGRSRNVSDIFDVPLVQSLVIQISLELGHDSCLKKGSYEQREGFALQMQKSKSTKCSGSVEYDLFWVFQLVSKQSRSYTR